MTESRYPIRPLLFSSNPGSVKEEGDELIIPRGLLREWIDLFPPGQPMLAHVSCDDTGMNRIVCIGCDNEEPFVFAPNWILAQLGLSPDTEATVNLYPCLEELPMATKITVQLELGGLEMDVRQLLETHLDMFHVLEEGTVLTIQQEEGEVYAIVIAIEPAPQCRLGGEVILDIVEDPTTPEHFISPDSSETETTPETVATTESTPETVATTEAATEATTTTATTTTTVEEIRQARIRRFAAMLNIP
jgi:hypothetical protein